MTSERSKYDDFYAYVSGLASAKWTDIADGEMKKIVDGIEKAAKEGRLSYTTDNLPYTVIDAVRAHPVMQNFTIFVDTECWTYKKINGKEECCYPVTFSWKLNSIIKPS